MGSNPISATIPCGELSLNFVYTLYGYMRRGSLSKTYICKYRCNPYTLLIKERCYQMEKYFIRVNNGEYSYLYYRVWSDGSRSFTFQDRADFYDTLDKAKSHLPEAKSCIVPELMSNLCILKVTEEEIPVS